MPHPPGSDLRAFLNPAVPDEDHALTIPDVSVSVNMQLLFEAFHKSQMRARRVRRKDIPLVFIDNDSSLDHFVEVALVNNYFSSNK